MGTEENGEDLVDEVSETEADEADEAEDVSIKPKSRARKSTRVDVDDTASESDESNREDWISEYEGQLTLDVYQTKDNVVIKSTIAGVKSEDLDITIANDMVTIKGERKKEEEAKEDDYFYQECYWGSFSRSIILPVDIDVEGVEADLKDGILTVILPKAAKAKTKKIKIKGSV
jgi:HSP20 family protein